MEIDWPEKRIEVRRILRILKTIVEILRTSLDQNMDWGSVDSCDIWLAIMVMSVGYAEGIWDGCSINEEEFGFLMKIMITKVMMAWVTRLLDSLTPVVIGHG